MLDHWSKRSTSFSRCVVVIEVSPFPYIYGLRRPPVVSDFPTGCASSYAKTSLDSVTSCTPREGQTETTLKRRGDLRPTGRGCSRGRSTSMDSPHMYTSLARRQGSKPGKITNNTHYTCYTHYTYYTCGHHPPLRAKRVGAGVGMWWSGGACTARGGVGETLHSRRSCPPPPQAAHSPTLFLVRVSTCELL